MDHDHFIVVGGMRCGSTYLARLLDEHPEILMASPLIPEPKFFLNEDCVKEGMSKYLERFFPHNENFKCLGEKSVSYLETHAAGERIKQCLPDCKIIIILRDPVKRAISHYWYTRNHGLEKRDLNKVFQDSVDLKTTEEFKNISMFPFLYLRRGLYFENVRAYERLFGRNKMLLLVLEHFLVNLKSNLRELYRFAGVNEEFLPVSEHKKENESIKDERGVSQDTVRRLAEYFKFSNERLASTYSLDLSFWTKP